MVRAAWGGFFFLQGGHAGKGGEGRGVGGERRRRWLVAA